MRVNVAGHRSAITKWFLAPSSPKLFGEPSCGGQRSTIEADER